MTREKQMFEAAMPIPERLRGRVTLVVVEVKRNGEVVQDNQYRTVADATVKFNDWHAYFIEEGMNIRVVTDTLITAWRGHGPTTTVYDVRLIEFKKEATS
jgi:hypothetical protein